jgi:nucleoid-associated protein YgaU
MKKKTATKVIATTVMALNFAIATPIRTEAMSTVCFSWEDLAEGPEIVIHTVTTEVPEFDYVGDEFKQVGIKKIVEPYYITTEGETIETIAENLKLSTAELLEENSDYKTPEEPFGNLAYVAIPNDISWNEVEEETYYLVSSGDNLWNISRYFDTNISTLQELNPDQLENPNLIFAGELIRVR